VSPHHLNDGVVGNAGEYTFVVEDWPMAYVNVQPDLMAAAATDVAQIRSAIGAANVAAAGPTTGLVAAAGDEVSAATAALFNSYAREYQAVIGQAAAFHDEFAQLLATAGSAYTQAEAEIAATLGPLTGAGAAAPAYGVAAAKAADPAVTAILIMTGSGTATPSTTYMDNVYTRFLSNFTGPQQPVSTPEGLYPFTGVKDLTLDISLARGVTQLENAINLAIQPGANGGSIAVLGYSQSAIIASMAMPQLLAQGYSPDQINFTLLGDISNPNGGLFPRFPGLSIPSLGITFGTATPSNDFPTTIWTQEYDGFADYPQYPIDVLSDLNALAGIIYVHGTYPTLTTAQLDSAIPLSQSGAPSMTTYYMIPTENLPLLDPVRAIPLIGNPLADLLQPDLKYLVNWGYGDPNYGWSTGPADVPTPFGFLPPLSATTELGPLLISGTQQGVGAFVTDLSELPASLQSVSLSNLTTALTGGSSALPAIPTTPAGIISTIQSANTDIVGTLTTDFSTAYATLLPTADIATAVLVSLPSYDVNLFLDGINQAFNGDFVGGLVNAFGDPIAADVGLVTLAGGFELISIENSLQTILTGTPNPGPF
jgi:PE-PPE domain/PE family